MRFGTLYLPADLSQSQPRLDVESQQISRSYSQRIRCNRSIRKRDEEELYACIRARVVDQFLGGHEP
ncbi:hypothetical protein BIV25_17345 [Streptomyces sp. MUSC 14]|nr:hypothetical protein BIV25_17345 [Streptomyces sp. MUSC 14]